jgi:hypothetical protein
MSGKAEVDVEVEPASFLLFISDPHISPSQVTFPAPRSRRSLRLLHFQSSFTSLTAETPQKVVLREILPRHNWRLDFRLSETRTSVRLISQPTKKIELLKVHDVIMKTEIIKVITQWPSLDSAGRRTHCDRGATISSQGWYFVYREDEVCAI